MFRTHCNENGVCLELIAMRMGVFRTHCNENGVCLELIAMRMGCV